MSFSAQQEIDWSEWYKNLALGELEPYRAFVEMDSRENGCADAFDGDFLQATKNTALSFVDQIDFFLPYYTENYKAS